MLGEVLRPGLWRWTARHPDWKRDVASFAVERDGDVVLIDPLLSGDLWDRLEGGLRGRALHVLLTIHWHARSTARVAERFPGTRIWAHSRNRAAIARRAPVTGDALLGDGERGEGLRTCPASWLPQSTDLGELRTALRELESLPIELLLVSHGSSILDGGGAALSQLLRDAP